MVDGSLIATFPSGKVTGGIGFGVYKPTPSSIYHSSLTYGKTNLTVSGGSTVGGQLSHSRY